MLMVLWTPSVCMNYTKGLINSKHRITKTARIGSFMLAFFFWIKGKAIIIYDPGATFYVSNLNRGSRGKYLHGNVTSL